MRRMHNIDSNGAGSGAEYGTVNHNGAGDGCSACAELNEELVAAKKELFNLRFQNATNQLDNTSRIKEVRKNIARIQTVITEKSKLA